jgi:hypothetical protein
MRNDEIWRKVANLIVPFCCGKDFMMTMGFHELYTKIEEFNDAEFDELLEGLFLVPHGIDRSVAYLNWRFSPADDAGTHLITMSDAYFGAAVRLIEYCINSNENDIDGLIFPILFLIINGIETYLKGLIFSIERIAVLGTGENKLPKVRNGHDLMELSKKLQSLTKNRNDIYNPSDVDFVMKLTQVLASKTSDMTFVRYPMSSKTKGNSPHFYVSHENITIRVDNLMLLTVKMHKVLASLSFSASVSLDWLLETRAEAWHEIDSWC